MNTTGHSKLKEIVTDKSFFWKDFSIDFAVESLRSQVSRYLVVFSVCLILALLM